MRGNTSSVVRLLAVAVAVVAAAAVSVAPSAAQTAGYSDVPEGAFYAQPVAKLAELGVFADTDCEDGFCPATPIDRKTMAVWVVRALDNEDPAAISEARFTDVDGDSFFAPFVERMADLGITRGCGDGTRFCPDRSVSRAEMAAFLARAFELEPAGSAGFTDTSGSFAAGDIDALAKARITDGCATQPRRYCPEMDVNRAQMATFLARALNLVPRPDPPAQPRIAFVSNRDGDTEIFVMNHDGSSPRQITNNNYPDGSPEWSPTAPLLVFHSWPDDRAQISVASADDAASVRQLTFNDWAADPEWSPDGTRIAFVRGSNVFTISSEGTNLEEVTSSATGCGSDRTPINSGGGAWGVNWSPSGRQILYTERGHDGGRRNWFFRDRTSCSFVNDDRADVVPGIRIVSSTRITRRWEAGLVSQFSYWLLWDQRDRFRATWEPFGNRIEYSDRGGIWLIDSTGADQRQLTDHGVGPVWSPDGSHVAFVSGFDASGVGDIFVVAADGSSLERITHAGARNPAWSPDGARIAFDSTRDGDYEIYVINADGTDLRQLTDNTHDDFHPDW